MTDCVTIRVPATTANIGPGFDCLGLALDLWNETVFSVEGSVLEIIVEGEGVGQVSLDETNLIYQSFCQAYVIQGKKVPNGLRIACKNQIPLCSGLGSSSAAVLTGVLGANELLGKPLSHEDIIHLSAQIEGHPDNVAPAFYGGLTISNQNEKEVITKEILIPEWKTVVILPEISLSTQNSRNVLPESVSLKDAVFNIGRTALAIEALRQGDNELLRKAMVDRLHQPYRLALIPGAKEAIQAAQELGASAALSGAGPSVIAFCERPIPVLDAMRKAFAGKGIPVRVFTLKTLAAGAQTKAN